MLASWASIISEIPLKLRKRFEELVKKMPRFLWKVLALTMQNKANTSLIKKTLKHAYVMGRVGVAVEAIVGAPVGIEPINKVF